MSTIVHIIGGGLAGSEAAWQLARAGVKVRLSEMRGGGDSTAAHHTDGLAELMASGQIWEGDAPEGMRPDGTLPDYFESIDAGRDLMRAKDYAAAQAAFEAALRARPDDRIAKQNLRRATELNQADGTAFQQWFKRT